MRLTVRMKDPRWDKRHAYMSGIISHVNSYTGNIVARYPWLDENWFCLQEDSGIIRILHKDNIVDGWSLPDTAAKQETRYVNIPGKSGKQYTVTLSDDNTRFSCNCTGYGYRRKCSHIDEVMEAA